MSQPAGNFLQDEGKGRPSGRWRPEGSRHLRAATDHWLATALLVMVVGLVPWVGFLAASLPPRYDASHWRLLWVGFDIVLIAVLAFTAWAVWNRRQVMVASLLVAGTLLLCDAWFDIVTSLGHGDQWVTLLTGVAAEIPLALSFFWLAHRALVHIVRNLYDVAGWGEPPRRLLDVEVLTARRAGRRSP